MAIEVSDADLARQIAQGTDRGAETELFRRMAPRVRLYGLRHLRDPYAADDLVQHVLITTLEALRSDRLRDPEKLASFMLGTCRMTVLDMRRGAQRKQRLNEQFVREVPKTVEPVFPPVNQDDLTRCVESLKERERAVIMMSYYDEQTCAEVGGFLGLSEGNVRVIRHRALHNLRGCLGGNS